MPKKIIIADDDFDQRDLYLELFKRAGFAVTTANDGLDAWEKIQKDKPDLVFTGIKMPRMSGFQLIEKLRSSRTTETTPVIIFSHLGRAEDRKKAEKLPFVNFMLKGSDRPVNILKMVKDLTSQHGLEPTLNPDEDERQGFTVL